MIILFGLFWEKNENKGVRILFPTSDRLFNDRQDFRLGIDVIPIHLWFRGLFEIIHNFHRTIISCFSVYYEYTCTINKLYLLFTIDSIYNISVTAVESNLGI